MTLPAQPRIAFLASPTPEAQTALAALTAMHQQHQPDDADVICALGGDGFMLQSLHLHAERGLPVFGMKLGAVGFLMNQYRGEELLRRLQLRSRGLPLRWTWNLSFRRRSGSFS